MSEIKLSELPDYPGPQQEQCRADIIRHLREQRSVKASLNIGTHAFQAALGSLIRDKIIAVDQDYACYLTTKGEKHGL